MFSRLASFSTLSLLVLGCSSDGLTRPDGLEVVHGQEGHVVPCPTGASLAVHYPNSGVTLQVGPNVSGFQVAFWVVNSGTATCETAVFADGTGPFSAYGSPSANPDTVLVEPGDSVAVVGYYQSGSSGSGQIILSTEKDGASGHANGTIVP